MAKPRRDSPGAIRQAITQLQTLLDPFNNSTKEELLRAPLQELIRDVVVGRGTPYELKQKTSPINVMMLKRNRGARGSINNDRIYPPGNDHAELWLWNRKPLYYIYHPYNSVSDDKLREFCKKYEFEYIVSPDSWYYVGRTLRVTIFDSKIHDEYWTIRRQAVDLLYSQDKHTDAE